MSKPLYFLSKRCANLYSYVYQNLLSRLELSVEICLKWNGWKFALLSVFVHTIFQKSHLNSIQRSVIKYDVWKFLAKSMYDLSSEFRPHTKNKQWQNCCSGNSTSSRQTVVYMMWHIWLYIYICFFFFCPLPTIPEIKSFIHPPFTKWKKSVRTKREIAKNKIIDTIKRTHPHKCINL